MKERIDLARRWLEQATPESHVDEFNRMMGLAWAGAEPEELRDEVQRLRGLLTAWQKTLPDKPKSSCFSVHRSK